MLVLPSPDQDSQLARAHVPRLVHLSQRLLEGYSQLQGSGRRDVVLSVRSRLDISVDQEADLHGL